MSTETKAECFNRWEKSCEKLLVGKKIKEVRYLTDKEVDEMGWHQSCLCIWLDDGTHFFPSRDDEGNGAGALFTSSNDLPTIPVIRI